MMELPEIECEEPVNVDDGFMQCGFPAAGEAVKGQQRIMVCALHFDKAKNAGYEVSHLLGTVKRDME